MKIAVSGSRGFLGSRLTHRLKKIGFGIIELDTDVGIDLTRWQELVHIPSFDCLIHLAAKTYVPASYENPREFYSTNLLTTLHALELCRKYDAKMIFTSSYVYGNPQYIPIDEHHPVQAANPYADSKILGEKLCHSFHDYFGLKIIIIRPFNAFGPGQDKNFLIPSILNQINSGKIILQDPRPRRDFIFVEDLIECFIKALPYENTSFEIFNAGSGISYSIREITEVIKSMIRKDVTIEFKNTQRPNEIMDTRSDISKAREKLNWSPSTSFEAGIRKTMESMELF